MKRCGEKKKERKKNRQHFHKYNRWNRKIRMKIWEKPQLKWKNQGEQKLIKTAETGKHRWNCSRQSIKGYYKKYYP